MDEKWKVSSKEDAGSCSSNHQPYCSSISKSSLFSRSCSLRSSSTSDSPLLRSLSQKSSSTSSSKSNNNNNHLPRSFSQKNNTTSIGRKYTNLAKEQKARFYIMRRCVAMLVCWHKHGES